MDDRFDGVSANARPPVGEPPTDGGDEQRIMFAMTTHLESLSGIGEAAPIERAPYPVAVALEPKLVERNRLTTAFRPLLAIPHLLLVGGPVAFAALWIRADDSGLHLGAGAGALGAVAGVCAIIAWFAIVFGAKHPSELWKLAAFYLRWRVRAVAYFALLRDEYPPFGDADYPVTLTLPAPDVARDRLSIAFRPLLAVPHLIVLWALGFAWAVVTCVAWFSILITGSYPEPLYQFAVGVLRWGARVEAYVLLLRDEYPPFSLD